MTKKLTFLVVVTVFTVLSISNAQAQYFKFKDSTTSLTTDQIELEVEAILKFFGSIVGGGLFHTADLHSVGGVDVGLRGVLAMVPDKFKEGDFASLPVFSEEDLVGLAFLHGSLGLPGNFEVMGRFFYLPIGSSAKIDASPPRAADSRGGVTLIGGGLKYGLLQMPALPKITLMGAYHALFVPEEFDFGTVSTFSLKAVASQSLPLLTLYVGGGIDITRLTLNDEFLNGKSFTENVTHLTIGANMSILPLVHVNGSYNISEFNSFALGIGISFR
ncbi:MAG: DUF6588 family protein [bacterium]